MTKKQVLFFIGEDIAAHLITNRVMKDIDAKGEYEPVLYYAKNTYSKTAAMIPQLREFSFFEKKLLNDTVYPYIDAKSSRCQPNLTPNQIANEYGFHVEQIADINDPEFVDRIKANSNIACAISIRCTQIFQKPLVDAIKETAPLVNLHSGLLPDYRGVMTTMRRMFDIATGRADGDDYGCTLHKIDPFDPNAVHKGIDTGKILAVESIELNPAHSGYQAHVGLVDVASEALINMLNQVQNGHTLRGFPQNPQQSRYFTFPTQDELQAWKEAGVVTVRATDAIDTLVNAFSKAGTPHGEKLEAVMRTAIKDWYAENCNCGIKDGGEHAFRGGCDDLGAERVKSGPLKGMILPGHALEALSTTAPTMAVSGP